MPEKIAIVGAGNSGQTMAADLALAGCKVRLYEHPHCSASIEHVAQTKEIELTGRSIARLNGMIQGREGTAKLDVVTTDAEEAIGDVDIINFHMPAFADEIVFEELAPKLRNGQKVVFWTSYFRTFRIAHRFQEVLAEKNVSLWETHTQPFGTRIKGPGVVEMDQIMGPVLVSKYPRLEGAADPLGVLKDLYPLAELDSALLVSLMNPNTLIHPTGSLLNTGRIEYSKGNFYMYREGITPAVARVVRKLQGEIQGIMAILNFSHTLTLSDGEAFWQDMVRVLGMGDTIGPTSLKSRYITEDVPCSLVPIALIGEKLGVDVSMTRALVEIGSAVCAEDYWRTGRTLESLGLDAMTKSAMIETFSRRQ